MSSVAIDVGGTFVKAGVIDGGRLGRVTRIPIPAFLDTSGQVGDLGHAREIAAEALDAVVDEALSGITADAQTDGRVFVSGQMAGLAFVDDSGAALAPLITWQDTRYSDVRSVADALGSRSLADLGDGLRVGSPIVTLAGHERPAGCYVTSLLGYVAGRIAGARATTLHVTDAASWGLFDLRQGDWSSNACRVARVDPGSLPRVTSEVAPVLPNSGVHTPVGDQQAALLGAGLESGWVSVNLATGCQVSTIADSFSTSAQTRPYFGARFGGRFLHTITHLPAGRLLTAELRTVRGSEDWEWLGGPGMSELAAVSTIVGAIADAADKLGALGRPVLFSGGLIQRLPGLQELIVTAIRAPEARVFPGDDAALAGSAALSQLVP